jgi:hypothetical protein
MESETEEFCNWYGTILTMGRSMARIRQSNAAIYSSAALSMSLPRPLLVGQRGEMLCGGTAIPDPKIAERYANAATRNTWIAMRYGEFRFSMIEDKRLWIALIRILGHAKKVRPTANLYICKRAS